MNGKQTGDALDHDLAHVQLTVADESDACIRVLGGDAAHPFGPGERLAGAAASQDQPGAPGFAGIPEFGRELVVVPRRGEVVRK